MLPIELVSNTDPPRFTWQQVVDGRTIDHNGLFPPTVEGAVKKLIEMFKNLVTENAALRGKLAVQSELLRGGSRNVPKGPITAQPSEEGPVAGTIKPVKKAGK